MKRMNQTISGDGRSRVHRFKLCFELGEGWRRRSSKSRGKPVVNLDLLTYAGNPANLASLQNGAEGDERYTFVHGDICDAELVGSLLKKYQPRAVVHFAAESHVDRSGLYRRRVSSGPM